MPEPYVRTPLQRYARIAGFLFILYIVSALAGQQLVTSFNVSEDFARTAANVRASELIYRTGLLLELCSAVCAIGLGWSLYGLLRSIDEGLALFGLIWRVTEGIIGIFGVILGFARIPLYAAANSSGSQEPLVATLVSVGRAKFPVGVTMFSFGSIIFFWLLLQSRFIARWLAAVGLIGSVCATVLGVTLLLASNPSPLIQVLWLSLLIAEVGVGLIFLFRGADLTRFQNGTVRSQLATGA